MARGKTVEKAEIIKRQQRSLELKLSGWSYRAIGEKLSISHVQAYDDVKNAIKELNETKLETAEQYRSVELERLDMLTKALEPMAAVGNIGSVSAYIRVMEQRAKLLGLYAPEKKEYSGELDLGVSDAKRRLENIINRQVTEKSADEDTQPTNG